MSFFSAYWVLPLLFMFHDFEELVLVPSWLLNHDSYIGKKQLFGGVHHSDVLAIGIWEEFCIYLLLSTVANLGLKSIFETGFKRHSEPRLPSTA
ncbi:HXXEE domain-containing protein [Limosilactobacillus fermentum]|uniref:HXXEE domain-containing protein n=1 Tax=Limosilactobacillus fermentum TaxID=1613 RepID=UPI002731B915|nr:HXXEE domain-containing protein [Limosilactobacillus fermentum]WLF74585.1 HXXEE domain-containing protein [Limosilactobacillus fermentum]